MGFMVGCCEIAEYIIYGAEAVILLARIIVQASGSTKDLQPLLYFLSYVAALVVYVYGRGKSIFWSVNLCLCALSLLILLIYLLGSAKFANFEQHSGYVSDQLPSDERGYFVGGMVGFLRVLPLASWFYVGVESLNFACNETNEVWPVVLLVYLPLYLRT